MTPTAPVPLIRLAGLFPERQVYAKCEFLSPSGCFKTRGAEYLLERLVREGRPRRLVVPSMGNTALGAAVAAREHGFTMVGVVPTTISRAKDEKLRALGVELVKIAGQSELLRTAADLARERDAYFVHPHLDPQWTDGYQAILDEVLCELPDCRSLVFPVGGGGLLMGLTERLRRRPAPSPLKLFGCQAANSPAYARPPRPRSATIADGLVLDDPHPTVQERIDTAGIAISLVEDADIRSAMRDLYARQALAVEPSSAITTAFVGAHRDALEEPVCVILTGANIAPEDFSRLIAV
jgi:threonine dehydratase